MSPEETVMQAVHKQQPRLVELTQRLIREKSVNPPGDETGPARVLEEELASLGMKVTLHEAAPKRVNVEAVLAGSARRPRFLFNGHTDVVPEGDPSKWTVDPFGGAVKGDLIYGRGAADMKAALAAVAVSLRGIVEAGIQLKGDVVFHAVADEEVDSAHGTKYMVAKGLAKADMGIVAEASVFGNRIAIRRAVRGNCWLRLKTYGKAAHASSPSKGINAVLNMSRLLVALNNLKLEAPPHKLLPAPTISVGTVIKGGTKTNVIPEYCEAEADVRITPGIDQQYVLEEFTKVISELKRQDPSFSAAAEVFAYAPPVEIPESSTIISAAKKATKLVAGYEPELTAGHGTNDGVYLIHDAGVHAIPGFGPGNHESGNAHGADENVSIPDLVQFAKIYALTVMYSLGYETRR